MHELIFHLNKCAHFHHNLFTIAVASRVSLSAFGFLCSLSISLNVSSSPLGKKINKMAVILNKLISTKAHTLNSRDREPESKTALHKLLRFQ